MSNELTFYRSKFKLLFNAIICLVGIGLFILIGIETYPEAGLFFLGLIIVLSLLLILLLIKSLVEVFIPKPYLILTDQELILNPSSRRPIPIKWEDIKEFELRQFNYRPLLEINLYNADSYRPFMTKGWNRLKRIDDFQIYRPFNIIYTHIRRDKRSKLLDELDKRTVSWANKISDQLKNNQKQKRLYRKIDHKYIKKSLIISLILTIISAFLIDLIDSRALIIVFFISFPFAKMVYDLLIGFHITFKIDNEIGITLYLRQVHYLAYFFVYMFGPALAPFGIIYLIIKYVVKLFRR